MAKNGGGLAVRHSIERRAAREPGRLGALLRATAVGVGGLYRCIPVLQKSRITGAMAEGSAALPARQAAAELTAANLEAQPAHPSRRAHVPAPPALWVCFHGAVSTTAAQCDVASPPAFAPLRSCHGGHERIIVMGVPSACSAAVSQVCCMDITRSGELRGVSI
jgi:hypothetical protein